MRLLINEALEWPSFLEVENEPLAYALDGEPVTEAVSSRSPAARARSISVPVPAPAAAAHTNAETIVSATAKVSTASATATGVGGSAPGPGPGTGTGKVQRMVEFIFDRLEMRFADTPLLVRYALCYITLSHYGIEAKADVLVLYGAGLLYLGSLSNINQLS